MFDSPPIVDQDLIRILAIPRRGTYAPADVRAIVDAMHDRFRLDHRENLREVQAIALFETAVQGGGFVPIPVGGGKTLFSLLTPANLGASRPLLLVPAALVEKTKLAHKRLSPQWRIPTFIRIESFELLGRKQSAQMLERYQPDLIVTDEGHRISNLSAGCTKLVSAYMREHPETKFVHMTGTPTLRSILDYAHAVKWGLKKSAPVPFDFASLHQWANVLDERKADPWAMNQAPDPGALLALLSPEQKERLPHQDPIQLVREAFRERLFSTMGVVTSAAPAVDIPIVFERAKTPPVPRALREAIAVVRDRYETPDGETFDEATAMWRHVGELAFGLCYVWDPPPPPRWKQARRAYHREVREILNNNRRGLHVPSAVVAAIDHGFYPSAVEALERWREIGPTYTIRTKPIWVSDHMVRWGAEELARPGPPILAWVQHNAFGEALSRASGVPFYGATACDAAGRSLLHHPKGAPAICSIHSCSTGFDLEYFEHNLLLCSITNARKWEQLLGRTHRSGTKADAVRVTIPLLIKEHERALAQSIRNAHYTEQTMRLPQKILLADFAFDIDTIKKENEQENGTI